MPNYNFPSQRRPSPDEYDTWNDTEPTGRHRVAEIFGFILAIIAGCAIGLVAYLYSL